MWPLQLGRQKIISLYVYNLDVPMSTVVPLVLPNPQRVSFGVYPIEGGASFSDDPNIGSEFAIQFTAGKLEWFHFEKYQELVRVGWYILQGTGPGRYRIYENRYQ